MGLLLLALAGFALILSAPPPANPVYAGDFPDPFILRAHGSYYAYATNGTQNVQLLRSSDLEDWRPMPDPLPVLPAWAQAGRTWAPSVLAREGRWLLYFTAHHAASGKQCIGVAVSEAPAGPFASVSPDPLICSDDADVGAIDPSPFVDEDGNAYLLWAECCKPAARIWSRRLSADARALEGSPRVLLEADQPWEASLVEAPSLFRDGNRHFLLYSANRWQGERYAIGFAECEGPAGPCRKPRAAPLLESAGELTGPGGQETFRDRWGRAWMAYHAWSGKRRSLRVERLEITDGVPDPAGRTASAARTRPDSAGASPADPGRTLR